jgi:carbohydrate-binding DOMON domain-containing protein
MEEYLASKIVEANVLDIRCPDPTCDYQFSPEDVGCRKSPLRLPVNYIVHETQTHTHTHTHTHIHTHKHTQEHVNTPTPAQLPSICVSMG